MKPLKYLAPVVIAVMAYLPLFSQVDLQSGLVACYSFSGNAEDGTDHGYNGTVSGATLTVDRNGMPNSAYQFDGSNDYINVPGQPFANPNYSYSLWAKATTIPADGDVGNIFSVGDQTARHQVVNFANVYGTAGVVGINAGGYNNGDPPTTGVPSGILPNVNQWYHIISVRTNSVMKLYVDGILIGTTSTNMNSPYYGSPVTANFGTRCNFIQYFNGVIDDIAIYDRAISEDEVKKLFEDGLPCTPIGYPIADDVQSCGGGIFVVTASNGETYRWYDAMSDGNLLFEGNPFITPDLQQTTSFFVSNYKDGMEGIRTKVTIHIFPQPELICNFADTLFADESHVYDVQVLSGTAPFTYTFDFGDNEIISTPTGNTSYSYPVSGSFAINVNVTDANGCEASCISDIQIIKEEIFIPNVITPDNGDDLNQTFTLYLKKRDDEYILYEGDKKFFMRIFNRWGKEIFSTDEIQSGWQGRNAPSGVYFYIIDFGRDEYKGWLHVIS